MNSKKYQINTQVQNLKFLQHEKHHEMNSLESIIQIYTLYNIKIMCIIKKLAKLIAQK